MTGLLWGIGTKVPRAPAYVPKLTRKKLPGNTKLTREQVARARQLRAGGMLQREIGELLGVTQTCISKILVGTTWRQP